MNFSLTFMNVHLSGLLWRIVYLAAALATFSFAAGQKGSSEWPVYGGSSAGTRYSPLAQINTRNVRRLQVAWQFDSHDAFPGSELQCNPLVIGGKLFASTPKSKVIALDAATGRLLWAFDPTQGQKLAGRTRSRGLTYWSDGSEARLFAGVRNYVYALDPLTGHPVKTFGRQGRIDLRLGLGRDDQALSMSLNTPGVVYKDLLIVGSTVAEQLPAYPGDVRAYDVRSGALRWSFHTLPHPGEFGYDTWPPEAWQQLGGVNSWAGMSLDRERGVVFVPTGSATYDFYGGNRLGDDLFANSLIALNALTGERIWHFQTVHHDLWDRDLPAQPVLVTVRREGKNIDAVAQITKSGFVFLFDREHGTSLFPIENRNYPSSEIPGEQAAAVQPTPVLPPPFARQRLTEDMLTNRTPAAHAAVLQRFQQVISKGQFVPLGQKDTVIFPGLDGGGEWGGAAFDPQTHILYVNSNEMAWLLKLGPHERQLAGETSGSAIYQHECSGCHKPDRSGNPPEFPSLIGIDTRYTPDEIHQLLQQGVGRMPAFAGLGSRSLKALEAYILSGKDQAVRAQNSSEPELPYTISGFQKFLDPDGYPAIQPPWGTLTAIDLDTGKFTWRIPLGEYPKLAAQGVTNTGSENYGGPVVTAGGLVFIGATSYDRKFRAFNKKTGKLLWETILPAAGNATPAVYSVKSREFVVIAAGGGKSDDPPGSSYVAFALPQ